MKTIKKLSPLVLCTMLTTFALAASPYTMQARIAYCATLDYTMQHNTLSEGALLGARLGAAEAGCAEINPETLAEYQEANF